ncbi:long-chain-fatty-acid--CoA ligase [Mycobacterium pseudokansasii]|uniref:long-chain-fatty-acid--CoA ligase n=1 Tax=Mycobacterium pseudokansasii TaxID=2341080 RepID=UPI0007B5076A|nr:long-chain fatty acid--CoA ligase [Mycobacterium pseudokansasii]KZS65287.1 long-chain-fatty-acid--CoA ligase [Mycobacterium kansasii]VAZ96661.1 Long-chain-fatty-acid--CoA ligase [Mycobacterium pseudokansasii]VAZ98086.1 Long-chain-fatty-acid--CoA ligase [Mycobacterium pseudokansasii]
MTSLAVNVIEAARRYPDKPALRLDDTEMPYRALDAASARLAGLLVAHGLRPGDRVGVMLPNVFHFAVAYYGVLRAGGIVVPMNILLKARETTFYLSDPQAKAIIAWHEYAPAARAGAAAAGAACIVVTPGEFEELIGAAEPLDEPAHRADDDTAVILYTSGTTGTPKGAELTHANLRRNVLVIVEMLRLGPDDVVLGALPLFHAFGQTAGLNASVAAGACLTLVPRFSADKALAIIERDGVTVFEGVPTMFAAMLHCQTRTDTRSLRLCISGGAALPVGVMHGFENTFGATVLEGYGLSETSPAASFNHPDRERKPGSIGTPVAGVEMKLLAPNDDGVGEIAVRGHNVMKGYWNRPAETAAAIDSDGWFHTGDLGRVDEDGYYFIVDRSKDMIIRGGYNVYPREIEEVLYEHPAVREAAVVAVPDDILGEEIGAAIALVTGATADAAAICDFVKARVAAYKYPRLIWFVEELPKGATGKILKRAISIPARHDGGHYWS